MLRYPRLVLVLLCIALWLPGVLTLPPLDRDESRFAQASRQMIERHDFIDIRFGNEVRYKKPIGIYWIQVATTEIAGLGRHDRIWTYRLASLLGGVLATWLMWGIARSLMPEPEAFAAAALLAATLLLSAEATIATTDAFLLACILAAQGALLRVYIAAREGQEDVPRAALLLGWAGLGLGILIKGPVALAVSTATIAALVLWDRNARWLRGLAVGWGLLLVALIVAPWALAIAFESHGQFYAQALGVDFAAKLASGQETHGAPPGYYLALATLTLWPATLFVLPGLRDALANHRQPPTRFLLAWAGSAWVMFEVTPTKLPHYILPAYPALIALAALSLARGAPTASGWRWASMAQYLIGLALLEIGIAVAVSHYGLGMGPMLIGAMVVAAIAGAGAALLFHRRREFAACATAVVSAALLYAGLTLIAVPSLQTLWVSARLAGAVQHAWRPGDPPPVLAGFDEPSLVFELGTQTKLTDGRGAAQTLARTGGIVAVEVGEQPAFLKRLTDTHAHAVKVADVDGLNYSHGRQVRVGVYRVSASPLP